MRGYQHREGWGGERRGGENGAERFPKQGGGREGGPEDSRGYQYGVVRERLRDLRNTVT